MKKDTTEKQPAKELKISIPKNLYDSIMIQARGNNMMPEEYIEKMLQKLDKNNYTIATKKFIQNLLVSQRKEERKKLYFIRSDNEFLPGRSLYLQALHIKNKNEKQHEIITTNNVSEAKRYYDLKTVMSDLRKLERLNESRVWEFRAI